MKVFWSAAAGERFLALLAAGILANLGATLLLFRKFMRRTER
jgi:hypothetical protein